MFRTLSICGGPALFAKEEKMHSLYALFNLPDIEWDLSSITSQGDDDLQLVPGIEGRKDQVSVQQTPPLVDLFAQVGEKQDVSSLVIRDGKDRPLGASCQAQARLLYSLLLRGSHHVESNSRERLLLARLTRIP